MKKNLFILCAILPLVFNSCSSDDDKDSSIKLSKNEFTLNYEDEVQIDATSTKSISYQSESKYVANVSSTGLITAGRIGKTKINLTNGNDSKDISIIVNPKYKLYPEPIDKIKFGDSKSKIKSVFGTPTSETSTSILYYNYHSPFHLAFILNNSGNITSMGIICETLKAPKTLPDFLIERYQIFALDGYTAGFTNEAMDMLVGFTPSDDLSQMMIIYMPNTTKSINSISIKAEFEKVLSDII